MPRILQSACDCCRLQAWASRSAASSAGLIQDLELPWRSQCGPVPRELEIQIRWLDSDGAVLKVSSQSTQPADMTLRELLERSMTSFCGGVGSVALFRSSSRSHVACYSWTCSTIPESRSSRQWDTCSRMQRPCRRTSCSVLNTGVTPATRNRTEYGRSVHGDLLQAVKQLAKPPHSRVSPCTCKAFHSIVLSIAKAHGAVDCV